MSSFNKEYVHCVEDENLYDLYGYFSDNIDKLREYVNEVNLRHWGRLESHSSSFESLPFVKKDDGTGIAYRFFYYDPSWKRETTPLCTRIVTNRELALWLAHGNGEMYYRNDDGWWYRHFNGFRYTYECTGRAPLSFTEFPYPFNEGDNPVREVMVRKWTDTEWHAPTAAYLGLGE